MKTTSTLWPALLTLTLLFGPSLLLAQTEIAIEDDEPAQAETAAPPKQAVPAQAAPSQQEEDESIEVEEETAEEKIEEEQDDPEPAAKEETQVEVEETSSGSMQPVYEAGIKAYQQKSYWKAVALLSKASEIKDPDTPKYYYAEAHAMMGVIFHFYLKNPQKACRHYQLALKIDPKTRTALKYRNRVCR